MLEVPGRERAASAPRAALVRALALLGLVACTGAGEREQGFEVIRVVDGDTILVDIDGKSERVRYIGIDTPETVHPRRPVECFGKEAAARNQALVGGKRVRLERDVSDRDRHGRLLRYVWVGEVFVNLELVRDGYASVSTHPPDVAHSDLFLAAQREAREARRGLWRACRDSPARAGPVPRAGCAVKGNVSSGGEKIYHRPDCPAYGSVKMTGAAGKRWFCTEAEAEAAGWRRAKNCP